MSQTPVVAYPVRGTKPWDLPLKAYIDYVAGLPLETTAAITERLNEFSVDSGEGVITAPVEQIVQFAYEILNNLGVGLSNHANATTGVHGVLDTSLLVTFDVESGNLYSQGQSIPTTPDPDAPQVWSYNGVVYAGVEPEYQLLYAQKIEANDGNFATLFGETITAGGGGIISGASLNANGSGSFLNANATDTVVTARSAPGQTAPIQVWTNSSGTVLASVDSYGQVFSPYVEAEYMSASEYQGLALNVNTATVNTELTAPYAEFGYVYAPDGVETSVVETDAAYIYGVLPTQRPLTVAGAPGQSADLTHWRNSSGSTVAKVDYDGSAAFKSGRFTEMLSGDQGGFFGGADYIGRVTVQSLFPTDKGLVVQGFQDQTADLQQWRSRDGQVLASVDAYGVMKTDYAEFGSVNSGYVYTASLDTGAVFASSEGPGNRPLSVYGAPGQSADLTRWNNSSGNPLASVSANGEIRLRQGLYFAGGSSVSNPNDDGTLRLNSPDAILLNAGGRITVNAQGVDWVNPGTNGGAPSGWGIEFSSDNIDHPYSSAYRVVGTYAGVRQETYSVRPTGSIRQTLVKNHNEGTYDVGHVIRGAAGTGSDLTQWQNSSGGVLASVDYAGHFRGARAFFDARLGAGIAPLTLTNGGPGDSGSISALDVYNEGGSRTAQIIAANGMYLGGGLFDAPTKTMGFSFIPGNRMMAYTPNMQFVIPGGGIELRSPDGAVSKFISLTNQGQVAVPVIANAGWNVDVPLHGIVNAGGGPRSTWYSSGRMELDVSSYNGLPNHGSLTPLKINHDGAFHPDEGGPSGYLFDARFQSNPRFMVTKTGNAIFPVPNTGPVLTSASGNQFKLVVADDGSLSTTEI